MAQSHWLPLIYQYSVGGIVFIGAIILAWKYGALRLHLREDRVTLAVLAFGFAAYLAVHVFLIIISGA